MSTPAHRVVEANNEVLAVRNQYRNLDEIWRTKNVARAEPQLGGVTRPSG